MVNKMVHCHMYASDESLKNRIQHHKKVIRNNEEFTMKLFSKITEWAHDRNLINGSDSFRQLAKLTEEQGELAGGICRAKPDVIKDSIGDMVVVLTILAEQNGITIEECIESAWEEIKDRKGKMIDGVFVKESE